MEIVFLVAIAAISVSFAGSNPRVSNLNSFQPTQINTIGSSFVRIGGTQDTLKIIDNADGYVYYRTNIYKSPYTLRSNLYILNAKLWFTPGYVANHSDAASYHEGSRLNKGTVGITLCRYQDSNNVYGGKIYSKAFWPQSSTVSTTLSSSFSTTFSSSCSFSSGVGGKVDLGDGAEISANTSSTLNAGISFTWYKATSSIVPDPTISAQFAPSSALGTTWNYEVQNVDSAGKITYALDTYVLFEMSTSHLHCGPDAFQYAFHVSVYDQYYDWTWWPFTKDWYPSGPYTYDLLNDCFLN